MANIPRWMNPNDAEADPNADLRPGDLNPSEGADSADSADTPSRLGPGPGTRCGVDKICGTSKFDETGHIHNYEVDRFGNGTTTNTVGAEHAHAHTIRSGVVQTAGHNAHSHRVEVIRSERVDSLGLLDSIVPNIYFKNIILENSSTGDVNETYGYSNNRTRNPHITGRVLARRRRRGDPRVYTDAEPQATKSDRESFMNVTIDLMIKEVIGDDAVGSWAKNNSLFSKLSVTIVRTLEKSTASTLSNLRNHTEFITKLDHEDVRDHIVVANVSLSSALSRRLTSTTTDHDGNVIKSYVFHWVDKALPQEPTHLTYFAVVRLNLDDEDLDLEPEYVNSLIGRIASESVIDAGDIVKTGKLFRFAQPAPAPTRIVPRTERAQSSRRSARGRYGGRRRGNAAAAADGNGNGPASAVGAVAGAGEAAAAALAADDAGVEELEELTGPAAGDIWPGRVHRLPDGSFWSGARHDNNSRPLVIQIVPFSKVQDLRSIQRIERLQINFSSLENNVPFGSFKLSSYNKPDVSKINSSFTDMHITMDSQNHNRFLFGIDYDNLLFQNAKFGKIHKILSKIKRENRDDDLSSVTTRINCPIKYLRIKRRRVEAKKGFNKLSTLTFGETKFNEDDIETILIQSGEENRTKISSKTNDNASIGEVRLWHGSNSSSQIRYITGKDKSGYDLSHGIYQYGVELDIIDKSSVFLYTQLQHLTDVRNRLQEYFNIGSLPENYNIVLNRFRPRFVATHTYTAGWRESIDRYITILWILTKTSSEIQGDEAQFYKSRSPEPPSIAELKQIIYPLIDPQTGNPNSVQTVIKLVHNLSNQLARLIGSDIKNVGTNPIDPHIGTWDPGSIRTGMYRASPPSFNSIRVEKWFDNEFDSGIVENIGYNYLSPSDETEGGMGLYNISRGSFEKRMSYETLKYYTDKNVDITMTVAPGGSAFHLNAGDSIRSTELEFLTPISLKLLDALFRFPLGSIEIRQGDLAPEALPDIKVIEEKILYYNLFKHLHGVFPGGHHGAQAWVEFMESIPEMEDAVDGRVEHDPDPFGLGNAPGAFGDADPNQDAPEGANDRDPEGELVEYYEAYKQDFFNQECTGLWDRAGSPGRCNRRIDLFNLLNGCNRDLVEGPPDGGVHDHRARARYIKSLPNQIKALLLGNLANVTNINWHDLTKWEQLGGGRMRVENYRPTQDPVLAPIFRFLYELIQRIEVLVGYELSAQATGEELLLKSPKFVPITHAIFDDRSTNLSRKLLCRIKEYRDPKLCLTGTPKNLRLPIYNKYFIIENPSSGQGVGAPLDAGVEVRARADDVAGRPFGLGSDFAVPEELGLGGLEFGGRRLIGNIIKPNWNILEDEVLVSNIIFDLGVADLDDSGIPEEVLVAIGSGRVGMTGDDESDLLFEPPGLPRGPGDY